ncbi:hypothetical protein C2S52_016758 [Perilla frutescens var. hirtella]|nr:hypothetical protein C2S52_016758 [Perilla frutescens var. hirtella]
MLPAPAASATCKFYSIAEEKVVSLPVAAPGGAEIVVGSSHGWVASFNREKHVIYLWNPISRGPHIKLPDIDRLPESIYGSSRLGHVYKLILTCSPASSGGECRAVMALEWGPLAVCCPGGGKWWSLGEQIIGSGGNVRTYEDFVYSSRRKQLLCLTENEDLESWDLSDPSSPTIVWKDSLEKMRYDDENYYTSGSGGSYLWKEEKVEEASEMRYARYLVFEENSDHAAKL